MNLPYAEAVFDISYFRQNPLPFYTLAHELYPGRYRPTITHSFITLLHQKGLLLKLFTQNIDCLEREGGVPGDKIIEAHGSFATQRCIECKKEFPEDQMQEHVAKMEVPRCSKCNGLVKPDIVFFGEALPEAFHRNRALPAEADLAIVLGTSLTVQPFASLPSFVGEQTPRLLINLEQVGGLGSRADDILLLGDCDSGVRKLAKALGWLDELEALWDTTAREDDKSNIGRETSPSRTKDEGVEEVVEKLTKDIEKTLKMTSDHKDFVTQSLEEDLYRQGGSSAAARGEENQVDRKLDADSEAEKLKKDVLQIPEDKNVKPSTQVSGAAASISPAGGAYSAGVDPSGLSHVFPHFSEERKDGKPSL